jgi:asparagine synthase (glutamine-hydrolysing)
MCGLGGIVARREVAAQRVSALSEAIRHRGPDDEGYVTLRRDGSFEAFRGDGTVEEFAGMPHWSTANAELTLALCHRRLSIIDLSVAGHQPMLSDDGNLALVFNGEIYNYLEVASELESLGWRLGSVGDTAVLLAAFETWGPACVERFRGMWAFAVYDRRQRRLTLSRDRFGIKPLYYARIGDAFIFASEIKGILAALPGDPRGSVSEVVRLLTWGGLDHDEKTLFEDVYSVAPGCNIYVDGTDLTVTHERHYDIARCTDRFEGSLEEAVDEYQTRFDEAITLHMRSDVRVGACLSGGLDSSLIVAQAASELRIGQLPTFTAVYDDPAVDERKYIDLQAARSDRLGPHFVRPGSDSLLEDMDSLIWAQDQPVASSSPYAQWAVMRLAATNGIKVLLDGQGADEVIGGYSYFAGARLLELIRSGCIMDAITEARRIPERRGVAVLPEVGRAAFQQFPSALRRRIRGWVRVGGDLVMPEFRSLASDPLGPVRRSYRDHCIAALKESLPQLLRYEDRSSMAFSIESRVPFLDHPFVEFVISLPTEMKFRLGWSKYVQRLAAEGRIPQEIVWRRDKLGFVTPQAGWQRAASFRLREAITQSGIPAFLDSTRIERLVTDEPTSPAARSEFWQTMFLLRWMHVFRVRFQ